MIIFSGKIENRIQAKVISNRGKFLGVSGIIVAVFALISCLIVWLIDKRLDADLIITLSIIGAAMLSSVLIFIPTNSKKLRLEWDYKIKFENDLITVVSNHQNGATQSYNISRIKKVVDYGKYYYLFLHKFDASNGIICQKNSLVDGTIEEFEELFKGKIIHKVK